MTGDDHVIYLGKLVGNLHSLEIALRVFLQKHFSTGPSYLPYGKDVYDFPVGTELDESQWTSYATLGMMIDKFNEYASKNGFNSIDKSIVEIRDALAHGRVSSLTEKFPLRLIKFTQPKAKKVKVVFNEYLTDKWFQNNITRVFDAINTVISHISVK